LGDRAYKRFFISKNCAKLFDERQKAFLRMVTENKASDKFTGRVLELLRDAKRNMLNLKVGTIEQVAQITGLSVEQVLQLQQKR